MKRAEEGACHLRAAQRPTGRQECGVLASGPRPLQWDGLAVSVGLACVASLLPTWPVSSVLAPTHTSGDVCTGKLSLTCPVFFWLTKVSSELFTALTPLPLASEDFSFASPKRSSRIS